MSDLRKSLIDEFQDPDYRYGYAESFLNTKIATQIKILREQRGKKQSELGVLIGTKQSGFSRFEDVNHPVWKTDTLWKIARALNVRLDISFKSFGSLIDDKEKFDKASLQCPDFENDPAFGESAETKAPKQVKVEFGQLPPSKTLVPPMGSVIESMMNMPELSAALSGLSGIKMNDLLAGLDLNIPSFNIANLITAFKLPAIPDFKIPDLGKIYGFLPVAGPLTHEVAKQVVADAGKPKSNAQLDPQRKPPARDNVIDITEGYKENRTVIDISKDVKYA